VDPRTGDVFELREQLVGAELGETIEMERLRAAVAALGPEATADEAAAIRAEQLVAVSEAAARKLKLGERALERRRRRRKAGRQARKRNR
jgi:hypothetical protein